MSSRYFSLIDRAAPWLILAGVGCLVVASPTFGMLSGVALVALGAGAATTRYANVGPLWLALHGVVYGGLYLLFLGATLDCAAVEHRGWLLADAVISIPLLLLHGSLFMQVARR